MAPPQSDLRRLSPIATALRCGALVLVGPALTVAFGLLPAALALALAVWIARRRALRIAAVAGVEDLPPALRRAAAAAVLAIAGVLGIVAARAIAALVVAFPAALWVLVLGLGLAVVAALF
ncbi:MAG: hypothetical protein KC486_17845, partial [Myxococcales bacterium]|nr:hypothetical protein [Myxococcales bacterium]